jgi:hypothetical protein
MSPPKAPFKVTLPKIIKHFLDVYWQDMSTNPYALSPWFYICLQLMGFFYCMVHLIDGYLQAVRHDDIWFLLRGFCNGLPVLSGLVIFHYPALFRKF